MNFYHASGLRPVLVTSVKLQSDLYALALQCSALSLLRL